MRAAYEDHGLGMPRIGKAAGVTAPTVKKAIVEASQLQNKPAPEPAATSAASPAPAPAAAAAETTPTTNTEPVESDADPSAVDALIHSIKRSTKYPRPWVEPSDRKQAPWNLRFYSGDHRWTADLERFDTHNMVIAVLDRRAAYPSAMTSVEVGAGLLTRGSSGSLDDVTKNKKLSGVFQVRLPNWQSEAFPAPLGHRQDSEPDPVWVTENSIRHLMNVHQQEIEILDSWLSHRATTLFRPFSDWSKDERERSRGTAGEHETKKGINRAIQMLYTQSPTPYWRPDWLAAIHASARIRHWVKANQANDAHGHVVGLTAEDEVHVLVDPSFTTVPGFKIGNGYGTYSIKAVLDPQTWRDRRKRSKAVDEGYDVRSAR